MAIIDSLLGELTLDPAGMHCPSWDDAFVSSYYYRHFPPGLGQDRTPTTFEAWSGPNIGGPVHPTKF